jgi:predicted flap endonuclease-1-like 5' DNA nuclease
VAAVAPEAEAGAPAAEVEVTAPAVEVAAPEAEAGAPAAEVEVAAPAVEVAAPEAEAGAPAAEVEVAAVAPEAEAGLPPIEAEAPAVAEKAGAVVADKLTRIKGIGPQFAARLAAGGITSFAALAAADPQQIQEIVKAPKWRQVDYGAWIAEAANLAGAPQPAVAGDDLTLIEGIGPVYNARLREHGITTFAQLAETDEGRLAEIVNAPKWQRVNYGEWIEQARLAAAGDEAALKELQDRLFSRTAKPA